MNDRFINHIAEQCEKGNHRFSEWREMEDSQERHCIYCGHSEVVTNEEITQSIPEIFNGLQAEQWASKK